MRFELHGVVFLVWSFRPVGRVAAWYRVLFLSRGSFLLSSPFEDKQKGRGSRVGFRGPEGAGLIDDQAGSLQGSGPRKAHIRWCCVVCFRNPAPVAVKA
ncbi:hypothetical protein GCM10010220_08210 [Streptomyces parvulus]|nr:hypothetical protein GCM10010220_08210 [Streptomyces parvulus]